MTVYSAAVNRSKLCVSLPILIAFMHSVPSFEPAFVSNWRSTRVSESLSRWQMVYWSCSILVLDGKKISVCLLRQKYPYLPVFGLHCDPSRDVCDLFALLYVSYRPVQHRVVILIFLSILSCCYDEWGVRKVQHMYLAL